MLCSKGGTGRVEGAHREADGSYVTAEREPGKDSITKARCRKVASKSSCVLCFVCIAEEQFEELMCFMYI